MYSKSIVLNREQHAELTISPSPRGYGFAAGIISASLSVREFSDAGRVYPIFFTKTTEGSLMPIALMGLEENENLFVDEQGVWDAPYIPAYFRRYPFTTTTPQADDKMLICFDEEFDGFDLDGGVRLFDEDDNDTDKMKEISAFLQEYYQDMRLSESFAERLSSLNLLDDVAMKVKAEDGSEYNLRDMLVVNEERLSRLEDDDVVELFRSGRMWLIMWHIASLKNANLLLEKKLVRNKAENAATA